MINDKSREVLRTRSRMITYIRNYFDQVRLQISVLGWTAQLMHVASVISSKSKPQ